MNHAEGPSTHYIIMKASELAAVSRVVSRTALEQYHTHPQ